MATASSPVFARTLSSEPARGEVPRKPTEAMNMSLQVNGREHRVALDPRTTLLDALREHLGLTGSKKGCDHGQCGACTVLIEGRRALACLTLAAAAQGRNITTIEGLADAGGALHPMQHAFIIKACEGIRARLFHAAATSSDSPLAGHDSSALSLRGGRIVAPDGTSQAIDDALSRLGSSVIEEYAEFLPPGAKGYAMKDLYAGKPTLVGGAAGAKAMYAMGRNSSKCVSTH
jgi:hypothetical protein